MKYIKWTMLINYLVAALLLPYFTGCNNNSPQSKLTDNDYKYWDLYYDSPNVIYSSYKFSTDGYFQDYKYDRTHKRYIMSTEDVVDINTWSVKGKDTLLMGSRKYVITYLSNDSLAFYNIINSQLYRMAASTDQTDY